jgi:hypothetical protein
MRDGLQQPLAEWQWLGSPPIRKGLGKPTLPIAANLIKILRRC